MKCMYKSKTDFTWFAKMQASNEMQKYQLEKCNIMWDPGLTWLHLICQNRSPSPQQCSPPLLKRPHHNPIWDDYWTQDEYFFYCMSRMERMALYGPETDNDI